MNRTFHARIAWYQYFLMAVLGANTFAALWCKYILPALLMALMLIVVIEQVIHTVYVITPDGRLEIYRGRFVRKKVIPIRDMTLVRKWNSMKFGSFSVTSYVLIEYGKGKYVAVLPVKEREFMELIEKKERELNRES